MPEILIKNLFNKTVSFRESDAKTVLKILHEERIDWMHACGAKGRCTSCKMIVSQGMEHMGKISEHEERFQKMGRLRDGERLACQVIPTGNIEISVPGAFKFPHIHYSDF